MSLCFLAWTSSHYKGRIFIHSLFCSCYQPGDLYIEKLLTLTIKAQSNVKLKVMKRWNCYMLLPILDCVAYGGWFQWLKQVSLVHTNVTIFHFFFLPKLGDMIQIFLRHTIFLSKLLFPSSYLEVIDPMLISL